MPTANDLYPLPKSSAPRTRHQYHREVEKQTTLTILSSSPGVGPCDTCKEKGLLFVCHCWSEEGRPIVDLCKACAIARAGGEEKVYLKSTSASLPAVWQEDSRKKPG